MFRQAVGYHPPMPDPKSRPRAGQMRAPEGTRWVLLFDGDCVMCNRAARRVRRLDILDQIWLTALQGEFAAGVFEQRPELREVDSLLFVVESEGRVERVYAYSDSVMELGRRLGGIWRLLIWLKIIPRPIRDGAYRLVARFRRRILRGKACPVPDPAFRARLLP